MANAAGGTSPRSSPTSITTHPPTPTYASTAITRPPTTAAAASSTRAKAPTRTYGRQKPAFEADRVVEEVTSGTGHALERRSTIEIPETDAASDNVDDKSARGDLYSSSQAGSSEPRSTSPTSNEDEEAEDKRHPVNALLRNSDDDSSSDEERDEDRGGAVDDFLKKGTVADLLRQIDHDMDQRDLDPPRADLRLNPPTSSSLPTLTESSPVASSQALPAAAGARSDALTHDDDDDESQQEIAPAARARGKKARVIRDTDSETEADTTIRAHRVSSQPRDAFASSSSENEGDVGDASPVRAMSSGPAPSRQQRLEALAAAKKSRRPPTPSPPRKKTTQTSDEIEDASSDDEPHARRKSKKAPRKPKGLTKKAQEEMHQTTARFAREQEARLVPETKRGFTVMDAIKNGRHHRPDSSDSIIDDATPVRKGSRPSPNTTDEQRQHSPISFSDGETTNRLQTGPKARRLPVPPPAPWGSKKKLENSKEGSDSDDDELVHVDELRKKNEEAAREKEEKDRAKQARWKEREARARAAKAGSGSDSDLAIEGEPTSRPRPGAHASRRHARSPTGTAPARRPGTQLHHVLQDFAQKQPAHHHEEPTESQFQAAGKAFGRNLDPAQRYAPPSRKNSSKKNETSGSRARAPINQDSLSHMLREQAKRQALQTRVAKEAAYRKQGAQQAHQQEKVEPERIDVAGMMEKKKKQREEQLEEDDRIEMEDDPDFMPGSGEEDQEEGDSGDENGSGSDVPTSPKRNREQAESNQEDEFDSDGDLVPPASSQNSDRLGNSVVPAQMQGEEEDEDEDEDEQSVKPRSRKTKPRVPDDEDEDEAPAEASPAIAGAHPSSQAGAAPAPLRMALDIFGAGGGDDEGGFSQFFDSQFSQAVAGDNDEEGFARPADPSPMAPTMFVAEPLISTAERAADAALLEARGAIHNIEPGTPREAVIPRQYINKQGFMTQTRPVGLFADSPSFSPRDSQLYQDSLSTARDSQSQSQGFFDQTQTQTQTQVDATPTQAHKRPKQLRRHPAVVRQGSMSDKSPVPTEVVVEGGEEEEGEDAQAGDDAEESFPSAAQPRNAFAVLKQGAALESIPEKKTVDWATRRREPNAFVDDQANLDSDEEQDGLNAASGDEDEEGHDAELTSLVDNSKVAEEVEAAQNARARELHQQEMDKREAEELKKAQNVAAGKARQKRGLADLDDDDMYDEYVRSNDRKRQARIDGASVAELAARPETKPFADSMRSTAVPEYDNAFLEPSQRSDGELEMSDDDDGDDPFGGFGEDGQGADGGHGYKTKSTFFDARAEALQKQRELDRMRMNTDEVESQLESLHGAHTSSPAAPIKTNNRIQAATSKVALLPARQKDFETVDASKYSLSCDSLMDYKAGDAREESQSTAGNGITAGANSAVTGYIQASRGKPSSRSGSSSSTSMSSKTTATNKRSSSATSAASKSSKLTAFRSKHSFAS